MRPRGVRVINSLKTRPQTDKICACVRHAGFHPTFLQPVVVQLFQTAAHYPRMLKMKYGEVDAFSCKSEGFTKLGRVQRASACLVVGLWGFSYKGRL